MSRIQWRDRLTLRGRAIVVLACAIFLAAFVYALDFYLSAGRQLGEVGLTRVALDRRAFEATQVETLGGLLVGVAASTDSALRFYLDNLATLDSTDRVSADRLESGARLTRDARLRIATALGAVVGVFPNDPLAPDAVAVRSRLLRLNTSIGILEQFFEEYAALGPAIAMERLAAARTWLSSQSLSESTARLRGWSAEITTASVTSPAALEYEASWRGFLIRLWISALAVAYCVAFVCVALRARRWGGLEGRAV